MADRLDRWAYPPLLGLVGLPDEPKHGIELRVERLD